ncbi:MAG: DUF2269 family protein [Actinomycetota bacterium]
MPLRNFLLAIHVIGAIFIFGPTVAYAFIGAKAKKEGAPVAWALEVIDFIDARWVNPLSLTLQPASGAWLIVQSKGLWDPFKSQNRWLLVAIIIYIIATVFALFFMTPWGKKAHRMAASNQFGPEFGGLMKRIAMGGQALTVALLTITVLMVTKPGSGFIHP